MRDYVLYQCKVLSIEKLKETGTNSVIIGEDGEVPELVGHSVHIPHTNISCIISPEDAAARFEVGDHRFVDLQCAPGYEGNLCGSCSR